MLNFRTTLIHPKTGQELMEPRQIGAYYIQSGKFFIDFLASTPIDVMLELVMGDELPLQWISLAKLVRITRLSRIIQYMRAHDDIKLSLKLVQFIFSLILYIHLNSCFWYIIVSLTDKGAWLPPTDFIWYETTY